MYNDDEIRTYRPSGIFSPLGAVLFTLTTFIMLSLLFIPYLWLVRICPIVYINILLAAAVSAGAGIVGGLITKMFKIRNVKVTIICTTIALLGATYVKWVMYDYNDNTVVIKEAMQDYTAYDYYNLKEVFPENSDLDIQIEYYLSDDNWHEYEYDKLFGTTVSQVRSSIESAKKTDAYSFTYAPGKFEEISFFFIFSHPAYLWEDIVAINKEGRWTLNSSSSSYSDSYSNNVSGILLWAVWLCEFAFFAVVLYCIAVETVKHPFIEADNEWAEKGKFSNKLRFAACSESVHELRYILMTDENRFFQQKYTPADTPVLYIGVDLFMSRDRNEDYLSAYLYTYIEKNKTYAKKKIVKYAYCDRDLCLYLLNLIGEH